MMHETSAAAANAWPVCKRFVLPQRLPATTGQVTLPPFAEPLNVDVCNGPGRRRSGQNAVGA
jgi:hypothetical protein